MTHGFFADVFGDHLDADFHRAAPGVVDRGEEGHQLADMDGLAKVDLVHRQGHHVAAGIAAGAGVGDLVEVLEQVATVHIAGEIGHVRGHQHGHRQLGVYGFHNKLFKGAEGRVTRGAGSAGCKDNARTPGVPVEIR